jgi:hypothetical protein
MGTVQSHMEEEMDNNISPSEEVSKADLAENRMLT